MANFTWRESIATALLSTALATIFVHAIFSVPGIVQMSTALHQFFARGAPFASPITWLPAAGIASFAITLFFLTWRGHFSRPMNHSAVFLTVLGIALALNLLLFQAIGNLLKNIAPHEVLWLPPFETLTEIALVLLVVLGYRRPAPPCMKPVGRLWVPVLAFFTAFWAMMPTLAWLKTHAPSVIQVLQRVGPGVMLTPVVLGVLSALIFMLVANRLKWSERVPTKVPGRVLGWIALVGLYLYAAGRMFTSTIQGGGPSFVFVTLFAPTVLMPGVLLGVLAGIRVGWPILIRVPSQELENAQSRPAA